MPLVQNKESLLPRGAPVLEEARNILEVELLWHSKNQRILKRAVVRRAVTGTKRVIEGGRKISKSGELAGTLRRAHQGEDIYLSGHTHIPAT